MLASKPSYCEITRMESLGGTRWCANSDPFLLQLQGLNADRVESKIGTHHTAGRNVSKCTTLISPFCSERAAMQAQLESEMLKQKEAGSKELADMRDAMEASRGSEDSEKLLEERREKLQGEAAAKVC